MSRARIQVAGEIRLYLYYMYICVYRPGLCQMDENKYLPTFKHKTKLVRSLGTNNF
jgi:hypothetical protein